MSDTDIAAPAAPVSPRAGDIGIFMPHRHFWIVGGSTTAVWSSATFGAVPVTDPDYLAWFDAGHRPDAVASLAEIDARLRPYGLSTSGPVRSATVSKLLDALSTSQRAAIAADHMGRLLARAQLGPVVLGDPKVKRAADDMHLTPDAWFILAGA